MRRILNRCCLLSNFNTTPCYGSTELFMARESGPENFNTTPCYGSTITDSICSEQPSSISIQLLVTVQLLDRPHILHPSLFQYNSLLRFNCNNIGVKCIINTFQYNSLLRFNVFQISLSRQHNLFQYNSLLRFNL